MKANAKGGAYLCAYIDPEERDQLDALARLNNRSRSAEIRRALARYLRVEMAESVWSGADANESSP